MKSRVRQISQTTGIALAQGMSGAAESAGEEGERMGGNKKKRVFESVFHV